MQGCDIPNVELVVQFMVPASLSIWIQRASRGGRNSTIKARAILLVQPTIYQEKTSKNGVEDGAEDDTPRYRKDVEEGLQAWIETTCCRRDVADEYFNNTPKCKSTY